MAQTEAAAAVSANLDSEVGKAVVDLGLATRTEIEFCREQQKQSSDPNQKSLADLLVEHNFITTNQAKRIRQSLDERRSSQIPGYQLISKLGKGAMATVYKARQLSLDRIVAVKVLPKKMSKSRDFLDRFYKEGRAAARLSHNNIVQAIDVGSTPDGYHYFVMEYVEGKTLYDVMAVPPHGVAKLTDLGLARATDDAQAAQLEAGKAYGTPYYISPEQIRGDLDI